MTNNTDKSDKTINLLFHSGKLWYSEKPIPDIEANRYKSMKNDFKVWLSTAYEVVNPEAISNVSYSIDKELCHGIMKLSNGDLITLPKGYGIEKHYQHDSGPLVRRVAITLPENSAIGYTEGSEYSGEYIGDLVLNKETGDLKIVASPIETKTEEDFISEYQQMNQSIRDAEDILNKLSLNIARVSGMHCRLQSKIEPKTQESQEEMWVEMEKYFVQQSIIRRGVREIFADFANEFILTRK